MPKTLTTEIVQAAIEGFEAQKRHIDSQIKELRASLNGQPPTVPAGPEPVKAKRQLSKAGRMAIAAAAKKRWAAVHAKKAQETAKTPAKK